MNNLILVLNGMARSGKSTFSKKMETLSLEKGIHFYEWNTVDFLKTTFPTLFGREYSPDSEQDRAFLSATKKSLNEIYGYTITEYKNIIENISNSIIVVHSREVKEIEEFKELALENGDSFSTVFINNPRVKTINSNPSDRDCANYNYDYYIDNDSTLLHYYGLVRSFFFSILQTT